MATTALAALIQLRHEVDGRAMAGAVALVAGAALVAGHLVDLVWSRPRFDPAVARGLTAVLASTVAGALVAVARLHGSVEFNTERSLLLGGALGVVTALFAVGASFIEQTSTLPVDGVARRLRPLFGALLCLALMSPVAYLLCLAIRG
jgi:drug/metabolite transporter (DMT)-like permease